MDESERMILRGGKRLARTQQQDANGGTSKPGLLLYVYAKAEIGSLAISAVVVEWKPREEAPCG